MEATMFFRTRKFGDREYIYAEERWRENGKVKSKSTLVGRSGGGASTPPRRRPPSSGPPSPGVLVPLLPLMIMHELATGKRASEMKERIARAGKYEPRPNAWQIQKGTLTARQFDRAYREQELQKARDPTFLAKRAEMMAKWRDDDVRAREAKASAKDTADHARNEFMSLRDENQAKIVAYNAKVATDFEAKDKARDDWEAEQAAAKESDAKAESGPSSNTP